MASSTTKHPTKNHLLTYDNNNTNINDNINNNINNNNNNSNNNPKINHRSYRAEHNHQDDRKIITVNTQTTRKRKQPGSSGNHKPGSSANNSKSMSKTLSDNKTSFSILNIRVLSISVNLRLTGDKCAIDEGVPSLVRIPKSDRPSSCHFSLDSLDNYSLLGSCLHSGKYNNIKSNSSLLSNNNDNYKSVILLSSTSNHYFLRVEMDGGAIATSLFKQMKLKYQAFTGVINERISSENLCDFYQFKETLYKAIGFNAEDVFTESLINPKQFILTSSTFQTAQFIDSESFNAMKTTDAIIVNLSNSNQFKKSKVAIYLKNEQNSDQNFISAPSEKIFNRNYSISNLFPEEKNINYANDMTRNHLIDCARNLIAASIGVSKDILQVLKTDLKHILTLLFGPLCDLDDFNLAYKKRWGIPGNLRLIGGGESSLNTGGSANWGSTQTSTTNNNNNNQSGWGGNSGNPSGNSGAPGNWTGSSVNRSVAGNPNSNQNQGPPGGQNVPGKCLFFFYIIF